MNFPRHQFQEFCNCTPTGTNWVCSISDGGWIYLPFAKLYKTAICLHSRAARL